MTACHPVFCATEELSEQRPRLKLSLECWNLCPDTDGSKTRHPFQRDVQIIRAVIPRRERHGIDAPVRLCQKFHDMVNSHPRVELPHGLPKFVAERARQYGATTGEGLCQVVQVQWLPWIALHQYRRAPFQRPDVLPSESRRVHAGPLSKDVRGISGLTGRRPDRHSRCRSVPVAPRASRALMKCLVKLPAAPLRKNSQPIAQKYPLSAGRRHRQIIGKPLK